ncbi:AEC family transporter [Nostoc sp.]|uniref:AEC family transporter n=1 Tax=Nostoc sp. TaxID=1180 RepID=UPI002FFB6FF3
MTNLLELYVKLGGLVLVGFILGRKLPVTVPTRLGQFLFWVGVPISIVSFLRQSSLSGQIWIAPAIAYLAILLGAFLAWLGIKGQAHFRNTIPQAPTQASLILAAMLGNTGYLGFPITLAILGKEYFAWALFYDLLGSFPGTYGLGVLLAARFGGGVQNHWQTARVILINPALWSFGFGLLVRETTIPTVSVKSINLISIGTRNFIYQYQLGILHNPRIASTLNFYGFHITSGKSATCHICRNLLKLLFCGEPLLYETLREPVYIKKLTLTNSFSLKPSVLLYR